MNNEIDLTEMVSRIIKGDTNAEEELVNRYAEAITMVIGQKIQRRDVTEDLSQEVFRIAIEKIRRGDVRDPERLSGFICGIARTLALEYFRKSKHLVNQEDIEKAGRVADSTPSQLERLCQEERDHIVRQVINELKVERDREVIYRYYIAEQDKDTICTDLHLTRIQLNNVLSRALQRYRELYIKLIGKP